MWEHVNSLVLLCTAKPHWASTEEAGQRSSTGRLGGVHLVLLQSAARMPEGKGYAGLLTEQAAFL